jgi:hypothetical protein
MNISHIFPCIAENNNATSFLKLFSKLKQSEIQPRDRGTREPYTVIVGDQDGLDAEDIRLLKQWLREAKKEM